MSKAKCLLLCLCQVLVSSNAGLAPFIDPCPWDDKSCLITSSQKAVPFFAAGLSDLGMAPLDPMNIGTVTLKEGTLNVDFTDTVMVGASKCKVVDVERNIAEKWLKFACECPITISGKYKASGQLLVSPITGDGLFEVKTDNIYLEAKLNQDVEDGSDGQKHWKVDLIEHSFDVKEKATLHFENLFDGDEAKAAPVRDILDQSWKDLVQTIGKPFVHDVIALIVKEFQKFCDQVPSNELEK